MNLIPNAKQKVGDIVDISNVMKRETWQPHDGELYYYIQFMDTDEAVKSGYYNSGDSHCKMLKRVNNMFKTESKAKLVHSLILDKFQCYRHQKLLPETLRDTLCMFNGYMPIAKLANGANAKVIHIDNDSIIGVIGNEKIVKWDSEGNTDDSGFNIVDLSNTVCYVSTINYQGMHRGARFYTLGVGLDIICQTFCNTGYQQSYISSGIFSYNVDAMSDMRQIIEQILRENADV